MEPKYIGWTATEHVQFIRTYSCDISDQFRMFQRLLADIKNRKQAKHDEAEEVFRAFADANGKDPERLLSASEEQHRKGLMGYEWKRLVDEIRRLHRTQRRAMGPAIRVIDSRHSKEPLENSLSKLQDALHKCVSKGAGREAEAALANVERILADYESPIDRKRILYIASNALNSGRQDDARNQISATLDEHDDLVEFEVQIKKQAANLVALVALYGEAVPDPNKINWKASEADCKCLFRFLGDNGFIDIRGLNVFLAEHFLFKGKQKTAAQLRGVHNERESRVVSFVDHLKISGQD